MEFPSTMFPHQPTWSNTRINLLQRCPRAFVLRYGLAELSKHHPQGQVLSELFNIQTPWVLMHQTVRELVLDYVEDYVNGTIWSEKLIRIRFKKDYVQAIAKRNKRIQQLFHHGIHSSLFQRAQAEDHLIEMGVKSCFDMIQHNSLFRWLSHGSIERTNPVSSVTNENIRLYCSPDLIHHGRNGTTLIKFYLYGNLNPNERTHQASLIQSYGDKESTVALFILHRRKWYIHTAKPVEHQRKGAMNLIRQDIQHMETAFSKVNKNNDLSNVPLADSYRACMTCNVRFMCPSRHGFENAKAEQRALMCN